MALLRNKRVFAVILLGFSLSTQALPVLKAGQSQWLEDSPAEPVSGSLLVIVSLTEQRALVLRDSNLIGYTSVTTGRKGHETPTGEFEILARERHHQSNLYDAPMPYMLRITWGGVALHAGPIRTKPSSHGCIRLPSEFAEHLYHAARRGDRVWIIDEPLPSVTESDNPPPAAPALDASGANQDGQTAGESDATQTLPRS